MLKKIAKAVAYTKAPKTTFVLRHPRKALRAKAFQYQLRHSPAPRVTGLAAALVALPVGFLLGKKLANGGNGRKGRRG